jgi:hypothetical protein
LPRDLLTLRNTTSGSPLVDLVVGGGYLLDERRPPTPSPDVAPMDLNPNPPAFPVRPGRSRTHPQRPVAV